MTTGLSLPLEKEFGGQRCVIRDIVPDDEPEVLRLFADVFGHPADSRWYAWKYLAGGGNGLGLWDPSGRLKAHCAGTPRAISWCGSPTSGLQVGDVMVSTDMRGLLMRKGPFQQVSSRFYATRVGRARPFQLAWGFPNQRHLRLGVKLDLFWDAGTINQLTWLADQGQPSPWHTVTSLSGSAPDFDQQVTAAWHAMASDLSGHVLGVRDCAYVRWRFLDRPNHAYKLFSLRRRFTNKVLALFVMRITDSKAELLDIIGPRSAVQSAMRAAISQSARSGATTMSAWASNALVDFAQNTGARITPSEASLAIIRESDITEKDVLAARWWWMGGDTDFL